MKSYINKNTKSLVVYTNFIPSASDTTDLIELTNEQYNELQEKRANNYVPTFNIEGDNIVITYTKDFSVDYKRELEEIKQWFTDNDWKVNKIVIGEWNNNDSRWLEYLKDREIKRARQDELNELLKR